MTIRTTAWVLTGLLAAGSAQAIPFHYLAGAGSADPTPAITASGNTPVALMDLTAADLTGVQVLWVTNGDNSAPPTAVSMNAAALADYVFHGGVLSYHDRYVAEDGGPSANNLVLPGAAGITFVRDFSNDANIDILNTSTVVDDGLDNSSLDGGTSSSHGYATTLPMGAVALFNRGGAPGEIVDFYYQYGTGYVYYSTIPLDYYLVTQPFDGVPGVNIQENYDVYATNEATFQASLAGPAQVPEPGMLGLISAGLFGAGLIRRRKAA